MMISPRKLIKMARKWRRVAALGRKCIPFPRKIEEVSTSHEHSLERPEKGHFMVYTTDKRRFAFPIAHLSSFIFRELQRMSEEEFGLAKVMDHCDSEFMGYVTPLMQKMAAKDVEKTLLLSITSYYRCSSSYYYVHITKKQSHIPLCACCDLFS
ncbi:hypothetical protein BUALT_Bualt15G0002500 [Buddleja alternifolia]|uniref:Small auxin up regulated protein n=1 Tax=Buddleja alternifolia TaxID=168488 RepID=A0AAV6WKL1_9LAMI|nr:hypothetical protein BUALT_Bualt15G0002500 [Buddleja alternifolia]